MSVVSTPRAVFFDLDGTLVDSAPDLVAAVQALCAELGLYAIKMVVHTRLYDGMAEVLDLLQSRGIAWGIVTNKPGWLTRPMLAQMTFHQSCAALVTGDCLPVRKPDPAPLLRACELAGVDAADCVFIGDDLRDVQAGGAAGMRTIAAAWGYLDGGNPQAWGADLVVGTPHGLPAALGLL